MEKTILLSEEKIVNRIYLVRGKKVMLDRDLAEMYGVETRVLNQAVKRNLRRFPDDFRFQLTTQEMENWISQIVISNLNREKMGMRRQPYVFTEQGVAMLSSVLNSDRAIDVNIQIIRVFTRIREVLITHKDLLLKIEQLEKNAMAQNGYIGKHEEQLQMIFETLKNLLDSSRPEMEKVGYKRKNEGN
jgi:hypothetical protein